MNHVVRLAVLASFGLTAIYAQFDSGQISGFVRDPSQSVVAGASVTVTNEGNGAKQRVVTNSSGYYVAPNLFVGSYSVEVEAPGFKKSVQSGIQLSAAAKLSIDIELTVGAVTDSVQVSADAALVQTETATVGRTVETKQIENLTMNGRNPIYLALLKPGVIGGSIGTFDPDSVSNGGFSINGARADEYLVTVDGAVATRTRSSGSMLGAQDVDTVEEVQILTANFNAEYGRSSGGQIRFVTKSGTTAFHGDLVENFRNSALDSNTWTRNHATDPGLSFAAPAVPLQPVRIRHQRAGLHTAQVQRGPEQAVLPLRGGVDAAARRQHQHLYSADAGDAKRRSQQPAEPLEPVLRPRPYRHRSRYQAAVSRQHHSNVEDLAERPRYAQRLSSSHARIPTGDRKLDRRLLALLQPAQGHLQGRLPDEQQASRQPARNARPVDIQQPVRRNALLGAVVAAEPHRRAECRQHASLRHSSTSSHFRRTPTGWDRSIPIRRAARGAAAKRQASPIRSSFPARSGTATSFPPLRSMA